MTRATETQKLQASAPAGAGTDEKRIRKAATRLSVGTVTKSRAPVTIVEGKGTCLGDLPYVATMLKRTPTTDRALGALHRICFGTPGRRHSMRGELRQFSGVVYGAGIDRTRLETRLMAKDISILRGMCAILGISGAGNKKADVVATLSDYLEKPHDTGATIPGSRPRRDDSESPKKAASPKKKKKAPATAEGKKTKPKTKAASSTPSKKSAAAASGKKAVSRKSGATKPKSPRAPSAYQLFSAEKRPELAKKFPDLGFAETSKRLGEMWGECTDRAKYEAEAAKGKERLKKETGASSDATKSKRKK